MSFLFPEILSFSILSIICLVIGFGLLFRRKNIIRNMGNVELIRKFSSLMTDRFPKLKIVLFAVCVQLLIFSGALPVTEHSRILKKDTIDIMAVFDVSKSMSANDFGNYSRLDQSKRLIISLLPLLNGNKMGLVQYAGTTYEQVHPTDDYTSLKFVIDHWVKINAVNRTGSEYWNGLWSAVAVFKKHSENKEKLLILFTDGGGFDNPKAKIEIWERIKEEKIKVLLVGIGSRQGYPIKFEKAGVEHIVLSVLEEKLMKEMAIKHKATYVLGNDPELQLKDYIFKEEFLGEAILEGEKSLAYIPLLASLFLFTTILFL